MTRVLVADDSAAFRALCVRLLKSDRVRVVAEAADGAAAVRLARALAPDVVLVDVQLGADDGWAVARRLRALDPAPRVVMVSSEPDAGDDALVARAGAERFVPKAEVAALDLALRPGRLAAR